MEGARGAPFKVHGLLGLSGCRGGDCCVYRAVISDCSVSWKVINGIELSSGKGDWRL